MEPRAYTMSESELPEKLVKIRNTLKENGACGDKVDPRYVHKLVEILRRADGTGYPLLEAAKTVRAFVAVRMDQLRTDPCTVEPLQDSLIIPSAPYVDPDFMEVLIAFLWVRGEAWGIGFEADTGMYDLVVRQLDGSGKYAIQWLAIDPVGPRQFPSSGQRHKARHAGWKAPPTPYYLVNPSPRSHVRADPTQESDATGRAFAFRFERRAHLRLLVERGMDAIRSRKGWQLFGPDDELGPRLTEHLAARGHSPKLPGEYLAVRVVSVVEHLVGPEDAEVVPSTQVLRL